MRKKALHANKTEGLDRRRQRAEMSLSVSYDDGDFEDKKLDERNPLFYGVQEKIKQARGRDKKEYFLLTMAEAYFNDDATDSEDEERSRKLKEANVEVKSLYSRAADSSNDSRMARFDNHNDESMTNS